MRVYLNDKILSINKGDIFNNRYMIVNIDVDKKIISIIDMYTTHIIVMSPNLFYEKIYSVLPKRNCTDIINIEYC